MKNFILVNIRNIKKVSKFSNEPSWKESALLPYYRDEFICFARNEEYSFKELFDLFLFGNESEQIGAISFIAERFPSELYKVIYDDNYKISVKKLRFLLDDVIPSYLPLVIPKEKMIMYEFSTEYSDDIWVKLLETIRLRLNGTRYVN